MKKLGSVSTGIQETTQNELEVRAGSTTAATAFAGGMKGFFSNPSTIATGDTWVIPADHNAILAGPITVNGTLTVNGKLTIWGE